MRGAAPHRDLDFIPVLGLVFLEFLVRPGDEVIATLKLRFADENAAVGVHGSAEFQLQMEILGKLSRRPQNLHQPGFSGVHHEDAGFGRVTAVAARGFAVEMVRLVTPAGEVFAVEQTDVTRFGLEIIGAQGHSRRRDGQEANQ